MRVFDQEEKAIINKILHGSGYARNLINILDSIRNLQGVRVRIDRSNKTANFRFETQNSESTINEDLCFIERQRQLTELIITHVTLLRYLEKEELAVFFEPAKTTDNIITFGMGAANRPCLTMPIADQTVVDLLIKYINKEIRPSPLLKQLERNNYLTDEEIKFTKQYCVTWVAVFISVLIGLYGVYNNYRDSESQEEKFKKQIISDKNNSEAIAKGFKDGQPPPTDYTQSINNVAKSMSEISGAIKSIPLINNAEKKPQQQNSK